MGSLLACFKPICLFGNRKRKEPERRLHKDEKREQFLKSNKFTLQDYIPSSPRSASLPITSNKRVYPNSLFVDDGVSKENCLIGSRLDTLIGDDDGESETKTEGNLLSKGEVRKKRVSFRMPEVADVFILNASPTTFHESATLQVQGLP